MCNVTQGMNNFEGTVYIFKKLLFFALTKMLIEQFLYMIQQFCAR